MIEGHDFDEMIDLAVGFLACGDKLPAGKRMGICTSSGGAGVWMADACVRAGLEVPVLDAPTRAAIDVHLPSYGTSQNPVDSTAQGVHKLGYAEFARLVGAIAADRRRHGGGDRAPLGVSGERSAEASRRWRANSKKPVFMWTYTLPSDRSVEILNEAGYPLFTNADGCARTMRAMADYRALRERLLRPADTLSVSTPDRAAARAMLAASAPVLCEWQARPVLAAYGIGGGEAGQARAFGRRGRSRGARDGAAGGAEGAVRRYPAQDRSRRASRSISPAPMPRARPTSACSPPPSNTRRTRASTACWCSRWRRPGAKSSSASIAIRNGARC